MKRIYYVLFTIIIVLISIECRKELSGENAFPGQGNIQSSPISATLQGNIINENNQPAEGVTVTVGSKTATTNSHGYFRIVDASLDKNASLVTAEQAGYFKAYRTFSATSGVNQVVIKLIKKTLAGTIDAAIGGSVSLTDGSKISLAANGVTGANGAAYTGNINVYASYIDPASNDIGKKVPGSFMGDDKNNKRVVLSSYGMLSVELESATGEKLQIAPNNTATLTIPIPSSILLSAPTSISLWYVDEQTGIWKEQGTAQKNGNNYVGTVKHFCYWNCDSPLPAIGFSATFKTSENVPLTNTYVVIKPTTTDSANGYAHGYTDSLGQVSGLIPSGISLTLEVYGGCNDVVFSQNIGPFTSNTNLGTIVVPNSISSLITIKGKVLDCNNAPVSKGYATVYYDNMVYNAKVTSGGEFSTSFIDCSSRPQTLEIFGVDETSQQQGPSTTISVTGQLTDVGSISACGTSSVEYINCKLDGINYAFPLDSFMVYSAQDPMQATTFYTYISVWQPVNSISFSFSGDTAPGVYPLNTLFVSSYNRIALTRPFNVSLTSFPQNLGEFFDGSFSGSFKDSSDLSVNHAISCSFHIRKY